MSMTLVIQINDNHDALFYLLLVSRFSKKVGLESNIHDTLKLFQMSFDYLFNGEYIVFSVDQSQISEIRFVHSLATTLELYLDLLRISSKHRLYRLCETQESYQVLADLLILH